MRVLLSRTPRFFIVTSFLLVCSQFVEAARVIELPVFNDQNHKFIAPLKNEHSVVDLSFILSEKSYVEFRLLQNDKSMLDDNVVARIQFSDENCNDGFHPVLRYFFKSNEVRYHYFHNNLMWNVSGQLQIKLLPEKKMAISFNGEEVEVQIFSRVKYLKIVTSHVPVTIERIEIGD